MDRAGRPWYSTIDQHFLDKRKIFTISSIRNSKMVKLRRTLHENCSFVHSSRHFDSKGILYAKVFFLNTRISIHISIFYYSLICSDAHKWLRIKPKAWTNRRRTYVYTERCPMDICAKLNSHISACILRIMRKGISKQFRIIKWRPFS